MKKIDWSKQHCGVHQATIEQVMELRVLGSGSQGNGYLLRSKSGESLILECGVPIKEVQKQLNYDLSNVVGCLASHAHGDHFKYAKQYCEAGLNVWVNARYDKKKPIDSHRLRMFVEDMTFNLRGFKIHAFEVYHDVPTSGFLVNNPEMGNLVFITDTKYVTASFKNVNHYLIEANYSEEIIHERIMGGQLNAYLGDRIRESHMSVETLAYWMQSQDLKACKNIILCHLSNGNSHEAKFVSYMQSVTGKPVFIADEGKSFDLSLDPF